MERILILNLTESFWQCNYCNWSYLIKFKC